MAVFREPTNIAMDRKGSRRTLDEFYQSVLFGVGSDGNDDGGMFEQLFTEGRFSNDDERNAIISAYYKNEEEGECSTDNYIPPSFRKNLEGAYRFTTANHRMPQIAAYSKTPMRYMHNNSLYTNNYGVNVLNLVGAGFDAWQQPDYMYYFDKRTQDIRSDRADEFHHERQLGFMFALQCACDHELDHRVCPRGCRCV